jgi:hypothetical protein
MGIAGIVGTFLSGYFANRATERRQLLSQDHEDRTRFHQERIEIYATLLKSLERYRDSMAESVRLTVAGANESQTAAVYDRIKNAVDTLMDPIQMVLLVASPPVGAALGPVIQTARALNVVGSSAAQFDDLSEKFSTAVADFRQAAREELLPDANKRLDRRVEC